MIDTKLIVDYIELDEALVREENLLNERKRLKKDLAAKIHSMLASEGAGKVNVRGVTVSPRRIMRASSAGMPGLIEALKAEGFDAIVTETVNAQTLTGFVNQYDPDRMCSTDELRERLPEGLRDHVHLYEDLALSLKRSD
jgi:hypothetical protein